MTNDGPYRRAARKDLAKLRSSITLEALTFWRAEGGSDTTLPPVSAIRPERLKKLLPNIVLLEALWGTAEAGLPDDFVYRIVGEASVEAHGHNATGRKVSSLSEFGEQYTSGMLGFYRDICKDRLPVAAGGALNMIGKDYRNFEAIYLPFSQDGTRVDRILVAAVYD